jgi:hypothetical protein
MIPQHFIPKCPITDFALELFSIEKGKILAFCLLSSDDLMSN